MKSFLNLYILEWVMFTLIPFAFFSTGNRFLMQSKKDVYNDENKFYLTNIKLVDWQTGILFLFFHKQIFSCIICKKKYIMSKFLLQNCVKFVYTVYFKQNILDVRENI